MGSSAESVGDFGFGEFSEGVIEGGLQGLDVPKTVGFSHRQFRLEIYSVFQMSIHVRTYPLCFTHPRISWGVTVSMARFNA